MVQIGIGEQDCFDRSSSGLGTRMPSGMDKLRVQVWRGIHQYPPVPVRAQGNATLGLHFDKTGARPIALATCAIPEELRRRQPILIIVRPSLSARLELSQTQSACKHYCRKSTLGKRHG